ncbi:hypothetical protein ACOME3_010803 [Neoechinorhynchus agilis]
MMHFNLKGILEKLGDRARGRNRDRKFSVPHRITERKKKFLMNELHKSTAKILTTHYLSTLNDPCRIQTNNKNELRKKGDRIPDETFTRLRRCFVPFQSRDLHSLQKMTKRTLEY